MFSKTAIALPLAASLLEQVNAFSFHRHQHAVDKRDNIVWHTVYETVYVTAGAEAPAKTQQPFVQNVQPAAAAVVTVDATPSKAAAPAPAQTTLSTAVKPAPTSSISSASNADLGFSKQGIAYNDVAMANAFKKECNRCGWGYNWGSSSGGFTSGAQYIPMLWGDLPVHTSHWDADAEAAISNGAKAMLSFNEPDMPSQSNMSPGAAAAAHAQYFSKYKGRAQIGSPAVTNSGEAGQGVAWLKSFVSACNANSDCHFDFCAVHWYSEAQYANTLFDHLKAAHDACEGKAIWLTEFAPFGSDAEISSFMKSALPQLDSLDYLHAYSYFMVAQDKLMSSGSALSTIGQVYAAIAN